MERLRERPEGANPVLARYGADQTFTLNDIEPYVLRQGDSRYGALTVEQTLQLPYEEFEWLVAVGVSNLLLADEARGGDGAEIAIPEILNAQSQLLMGYLGRESVDAGAQITRDEARNLALLQMGTYTRPPAWHIRQLFFPLVREVTAQPGETLRTLAERVSGDAEGAGDIRLTATGGFLMSFPDETDTGWDDPLTSGIRLLAPLPPADGQAIRQRAQAAMERLAAGETLDAVADDLGFAPSELAPIGPLPSGKFALAPAIRKALEHPAFEEGATTGPLESQAGLHIIELLNRTGGSAEIDEAALDAIMEQEADARTQAVLNTYLEELTVSRLVFDEAVLMDDQAVSSDVLAVAHGRPVTVGDVEQALRHPKYLPRNAERRKEMIRLLGPVRRLVSVGEALHLQLDERPEYQQDLKTVEVRALARAALIRRMEATYSETQAILREYYEKNADRYRSNDLYDICEIAIRPSEVPSADIMSDFEALPETVDSLEAFQDGARRLDWRVGARAQSGHMGRLPVGYRGPEVEKALSLASPGAVIGPLRTGDEWLYLWIDGKIPGALRPFEAVEETVREDHRREVTARMERTIRDTLLRQADFRMAFPEL